MEVKIQKLRPGAVTPRRGSADAAGYDLYACPADEYPLQKKKMSMEYLRTMPTLRPRTIPTPAI